MMLLTPIEIVGSSLSLQQIKKIATNALYVATFDDLLGFINNASHSCGDKDVLWSIDLSSIEENINDQDFLYSLCSQRDRRGDVWSVFSF
jgi:hypothetical protein